MKEFSDFTDEELIIRYRDGDKQIMDYLMDKYKHVVRSKASRMFILGADKDDLIQEGMIGLFKAVRDYDSGRDASFLTFAELCVSRQMYTAIQAANRKKHLPLNSYISLYKNSEDVILEGQLMGAIRDFSEQNPEEILIDPDVHVKRDGSPVVLFYSTHTSEAYLQYESDWYYRDESFRTEEEEKSVVAVAKRAKDVIGAGGFGVIHDTTRFDETYSGSYQRSMDAMQENLLKYPTIQITVDVHRDAFGEEDDGTRYKPVAEVNGENAAQIMIMAGCDLSEDPLFPDWRENLHLALRLQQKGDLLYPGLFRPLFFAQRNYNMHATHGSLLVEVGTEVNTQREADYAGELLGETILAVLNDIAEE